MARSNSGNANRRINASGNKNSAANLSTEDRAKGGRVSGGNLKNDHKRMMKENKRGENK